MATATAAERRRSRRTPDCPLCSNAEDGDPADDLGLLGSRGSVARAILDSLDALVAVVDARGIIVAVNRTWEEAASGHGECAGGLGVGADYLCICECSVGREARQAAKFAAGLRAVLESRRETFSMDYPCHSPEGRHWYVARVVPLRYGGPRLAIVRHDEITARKRAELAVARANGRLAAMSATDGLTGVQNRRAVDSTLEAAFARARKRGTPLSLALFDVDHFKALNDTLGHPAGDAVLRDVARILRKHSRRGDIPGRYGGEEFVVILPDADLPTAMAVAGRLRAAIAGHPWAQRPVTSSVGVAALDESMPDVAALVSAADTALYAAKEAGRNRVVSHGG